MPDLKPISLLIALLVNVGPLGAATTIVIDTTEDLTNSTNHTCTYTQGGLFFPAADSKCTLRRAIVEASARPAADRPITILFTGLSPGDPNIDVGLQVATFPINWALPPLKTPTILDLNGQVTIEGPAVSPVTGGPRIFLDTAWSLEVESENNVIRRIGFRGGGGIQIKQEGNLVDGVTIGLAEDGLAIAFENPGDPFQLAGNGIHISASSTTIQESVISGSFNRAIDINSGTTNVTVQNNFIGTRFDGTVPAVAPAIECQRSLAYDSANWYGGWGIAVAGSGHTISGNVIAGLHILQSANDTPPTALEIFGSGHTISNNWIGRDSASTDVGVCGQGIKVAGSDTDIIDNTIVRSRAGFATGTGEALATAILASDSSPGFGEITLRGNLVVDGPGKIYEFGPSIPDILRLFVPAEITSIVGLAVSGSASPGSPCEGCRIDFYLDDADGVEEALQHLGSIIADMAGDFAFTLPFELLPAEGLRTTSTTELGGVIGSYGPGTTSEASATLYQPEPPQYLFADGFESGDTSAWTP